MSTAKSEKSAPVTRQTRQRAAIVRGLSAAGGFRSAQALHGELRARGDGIGLATVYRVLQRLAEEGVVDRVRAAGGETAYRLCGADGHHHHLTCRMCGLAVDVTGSGVEAWAAATAREHGFAEADHTVEITGVCPRCAGR